uniref:Uncharacterized protein n=1 Tax=Romanomermis culicivorax TaxID=13658 RepID=A0A915JC24_ROMCU
MAVEILRCRDIPFNLEEFDGIFRDRSKLLANRRSNCFSSFDASVSDVLLDPAFSSLRRNIFLPSCKM